MSNLVMKVTTMNGTYHIFDFTEQTYQRFSSRKLGPYDDGPVPFVSVSLMSGPDADYMLVLLGSGDYDELRSSYITSVEVNGEESDLFLHGHAVLAGVNMKYSASKVRKYNG